MSTRATYHFEASHYHGAATLYIHHDGYPKGAAGYAHEVACFTGPSKGGLVERWIRALPGDAEITEGHEVHGDTEYRYTFTGNGLTVTVHDRPNYGDKWRCIHVGPTAAWINAELELAGEERVVVYCGNLCTAALAIKDVRERVAQSAAQLQAGRLGNAFPYGLEEHTKDLPEVRDLVAACKAAVEAAADVQRAEWAARDARARGV